MFTIEIPYSDREKFIATNIDFLIYNMHSGRYEETFWPSDYVYELRQNLGINITITKDPLEFKFFLTFDTKDDKDAYLMHEKLLKDFD